MNKLLLGAVAITALGAIFTQPASATTFKVEHSFCTKADCTDGSQPFGTPVADASGNYYGGLSQGGKFGHGAIYQAVLQSGAWHVTDIHNFCAHANCTDGAQPQGPLIIDTDGNLYGMTAMGGTHSGGLVFEISHTGGKWVYHVLHDFCAKTNCADGGTPEFAGLAYQGQASGVLYDGRSPLYGTTGLGGSAGAGTVYSLTPNGKSWTEKVIYSFCAETNCTDGGEPYSGVMVDGHGNLFGTAALAGESTGSDSCCGSVYELSPKGTGFKFTQLHMFCSDIVGGICQDGRAPLSPPIMDADGTLYGTAFGGGSQDFGVVYKLVPNGAHYKLTVLHNFCSVGSMCSDGGIPYVGALTMDAAGALYGTTLAGGAAEDGVLFKLSGRDLTKFSNLVVFKGANGGGPATGVVLDKSGALFGTATGGGKDSDGVFFRVDP